MESRFGHDFSRVRVHADARADDAAASVGASAFTVGRSIAFRAGRYAPFVPAGRRLLAHELAHVVQQSGGASRAILQRQQDASASPGVTFPFSVRVASVIGPDRLLLEFIKQYRHLASDAEAEQVRDREHWEFTKDAPVVTEAHVRQGYILVNVTDRGIRPSSPEERRASRRYFEELAPGDQAALTAEADREFWERTQYHVGQRLGGSRDDREMARYWMLLRDELLRQRQAIEALPPDIRDILFREDAARVLEPRDYATALRIAGKIAALTPAEQAEYKSRVAAETTDWTVFETAIDRFVAESQERRLDTEERARLELKLYGLEELYRRYRDYMSELSRGVVLAGGGTPMGVGTSLGSQPALEKTRSRLAADLAAYGFASIEDFGRAVSEYEAAFERETLAVARMMLGQYEHLLFEQERRYRDPAAAAVLYGSLGRTQARQLYEEGDRIRDEYFRSGGSTIVMTPEEMAAASEYAGRRAEARRRADEEVRSLSGDSPLLADPDFDRERLARAPEGDVQSVMLEYIRARRQDIAETRRNLEAAPEMMYGLDALLEASFQSQNIPPGSVYDLIIKDRVREVHLEQAIPNIILGVVAVAAGLFTGGGGTVAVLAAGTAFGISAYQALEEFERYEAMSAAHGAKLLSDDPSLAWVIVAVAGAGLDLAAAGSALRALRPAAEAFNETGDLVKFQEQISRLTELREGLRARVLRAAEALKEAKAESQAASEELARALRESLSRAYSLGLDPEILAKAAKAAYYAAKKGVRKFEVFLAELKLQKFAKGIKFDKLGKEDLEALEEAFNEGVARADAEPPVFSVEVPYKGGARKLTFDDSGRMLLDGKPVPASRYDEIYKQLGITHIITGHGPSRDVLTVANEARMEPFSSGKFASDKALLESMEKARADLKAGKGIPIPGSKRQLIYLQATPDTGRAFMLRGRVPAGTVPLNPQPFESLDDVVELTVLRIRAVFEADGSFVTMYPIGF